MLKKMEVPLLIFHRLPSCSSAVCIGANIRKRSVLQLGVLTLVKQIQTRREKHASNDA